MTTGVWTWVRGSGLVRCVAAALLATSCLSPLGARAQNATWSTTASGDFNNANNWTPTTVPTGTAFFGASNSTFLGFSGPSTVVGGWTFNPGASPYDFFVGGVGGHNPG